MATKKLTRLLCLGILAAVTSAPVLAANEKPPAEDRTDECGDLFNGVGPFDYRDQSAARRWDYRDTKQNHYDPANQRMRAGEYSSRVMHDIDFLLRVFPNHVPALQLAIEYERGGGKRHHFRSVDCYFDRARRFVPDDVMVVMMEGTYFSKKGDKARARTSYEDALEMAPESLDINYNAGLFFAQIGEYERALKCANLAYAGGYPLPGLKDKLQKAGYRVVAEEAPQPAPPPSAQSGR
jgi:tetratricopeptide (TPR) repeat protein